MFLCSYKIDSLLHQSYEDFLKIQLTYCERIFSTKKPTETLLHSSMENLSMSHNIGYIHIYLAVSQ